MAYPLRLAHVALALTGVLSTACTSGSAPAPLPFATTSSAVRPGLPERGVAGVVITEAGAPIADVLVCAWTKRPSIEVVRDEVLTPVCSRSDLQGGYVLELDAGVWRVVASAPEREAESINVVLRDESPTQAIELSLAPGGRLHRGRVLDPRGQPIAGAQITAWLGVGFRDQGFVQTSTTVDGSFELWATHYSWVKVRADGFAHDLAIRDGDDYVLIPESVVRGRVVDEAGAPIVGARVAVQQSWSFEGESQHATRTDASGSFELGGLLPGELTIVALTKSALGHAEVELSHAEARNDLVVRVEPTPRLRLRVVEPEVGPVAMCAIGVGVTSAPDSSGNQIWTDEDGEIDVPLPPGRYVLSKLLCEGKVGVLPNTPIELERDVSIELEVTSGRTIHGRALLASGHPLAHEELWLGFPSRTQGRDRTFDAIDPGKAETNAEGRFEFNGLVPGTYTLGGPDWMFIPEMPTIVVSEEPATEVTVSLPPSGRVEVRSKLARWDQYARIRGCDPNDLWISNGRTDGHGRVVFEHVPVGEYVVAIDEFPNCRDDVARLRVRDGETLRVELEPPKPKTVEIVVHVEGPDGGPVHGALVRVGADELGMTDAGGVARIVIEGNPSIVNISALAPGLAASLDAGEACDECEESPELEGTEFTLRLQPTLGHE